MFTFFTTAKPFLGKSKISQYNALKSWIALKFKKDIILFGTGEGYEQTVDDLGITWIPDVETSPQGTPTVNSMFRLAWEHNKEAICVYLNCDIILLDDFITPFSLIPFPQFLLVAQRYDVTIDNLLDTSLPNYYDNLTKLIQSKAELHPPTGSDIFAFSGWIWDNIPDLIIGRAGYDNELIFNTLFNSFPVIDASKMVTLIHQNHDYSHISNGKLAVWNGTEAKLNCTRQLKRGIYFTLIHANYTFLNNTLISVSKFKHGYLNSLKIRRAMCHSSHCSILLALYIKIIQVFLKLSTRFTALSLYLFFLTIFAAINLLTNISTLI